jgi:hypothetical protein
VGILQRVEYADQVTAAYAGPHEPSTLPITSPWVSQSLERVIFEDILGSIMDPDVPLNSRRAAMRIPAIARARNILCTTAARAVFRAARGDVVIPSPTWLNSSVDGSSPQLRIVWTVDDLIFYGRSAWWRDNAADTFPGSVQRINQGDWSINDDNRVEVNGTVVDDRNVVIFYGWHDGILCDGRETIRDARNLLNIVRARLLNPAPNLELHQESGTPLTTDEITTLVGDWAAARQGVNGGVAFTPQGLTVNERGAGSDSTLMIEGRNAMAVDIARMVGVSAGLIDATAPKASLNYETTELRNQELIDRDLAGYLDPITARLSLDDVSPHGTRIVADVSDLQTATPSATGPAQED